MCSGFHAKVIEMHINPNDVGRCNSTLVEDVETFFINVTVKLERDVEMTDYVIFEIAEQPSNEFAHYFDFNLMYKCNGISLEDETLYCTQTEPNVYSISKTERATHSIKGAKIRGFIAGIDGNTFCKEQLVPVKFNASQKEPELIINGEKKIIDENKIYSYIDTTTHDSDLSLEFTHKSSAKPCDITLMVNGIPKNHTKGSHARYNISIEERSIVNLTITCNECWKTEGKRMISCLIKHVSNKSLSETTLSTTFTTDEDKENQELNHWIIVTIVVATIVFLALVVLFIRFYYRRKKMHKERESSCIHDFKPGNTIMIEANIISSRAHNTDKSYEKDATKIGDIKVCTDEQLDEKSEMNSLLSGTTCDKKDWVQFGNEL